MQKIPLKNSDLVITGVNPSSAPITWSGVRPIERHQRTPYVGLPGDYFYRPMQFNGEWGPYTETIC